MRAWTRQLVFAFALAAPQWASGHGGLVIPPARNNYGNQPPMDYTNKPGQHFHFPGGSCSGDECLWFNEGCYIGCPTCSRTMPNTTQQGRVPGPGNPNSDHNHYDTPSCAQTIEPTLPPQFRSINIKGLSDHGDWTRYHPWRAPGRAPTVDPCGVAGAYIEDSHGSPGATPAGAKRGALGSQLPPHSGARTEWRANGTAEVAWMVGANHGGGYLYSVCPRGENLTEACLSAHPLPFTGDTTIRWLDGSQPEQQIPAMDVSEGTFPRGSVWRRLPVPTCNCDHGSGCKAGSVGESRPYPGGTRELSCSFCGKRSCWLDC